MQRYLQKLKEAFQRQFFFPRNEDGFLLVLTMFVLVVLTLIGISATNLSRIELQIAGNDRVHKETFYQADGGTEVGTNLLEENFACPTGFTGPGPLLIGTAEVTTDILTGANLNFWTNEIDPGTLTTPVAYPSDTRRHIRFLADNTVPVANNNTKPHTNLHFFGKGEPLTGTGGEAAAGYEGISFGQAAGGMQYLTTVDSQHVGVLNSLSNIRVIWRHISIIEGTCKY